MKKAEKNPYFLSLSCLSRFVFPSLPYPEDLIKDLKSQKNTDLKSRSLLLSHALSLPSPLDASLTSDRPCALVRLRSSAPPLPGHGGSLPCGAHLLPPMQRPEPAAQAEVQAAAKPLLAQVGTSSPHLQRELSHGLLLVSEAGEGTAEHCACRGIVAV